MAGSAGYVSTLLQLQQSTSSLLTRGCDDRIIETSSRDGVATSNRYLSSSLPDHIHRVVNRGSCTISNVTWDALQAAEAKRLQLLQGLQRCGAEQSKDLLFTEFSDLRRRIKELIIGANSLDPCSASDEGHCDFDIVTCPSGTDCEFVPLLIARARAGGSTGGSGRIVNIVAAQGEVGSGTEFACGLVVIASPYSP